MRRGVTPSPVGSGLPVGPFASSVPAPFAARPMPQKRAFPLPSPVPSGKSMGEVSDAMPPLIVKPAAVRATAGQA